MIENERQYGITLDRIGMFRKSIGEFRTRKVPEDTDPVLWRAQLTGMESMLATLESEVSDYRMRMGKSG